jgi:outer membrane receptor protein involved in Fe transport
MQQTAPSSADDVLNQLPAFRPSSGPNQVQRNSGSISTGQSLANLRGLGAQRTLLLIDGRRPVPTNAQGTTSTAIIPLGLVKRLDVVTGGASAAYGSDAVAGVANFVLADRLKRLQGSIYGGISQHGDNKEFGISLADGVSLLNDRLHIVGGIDYNKNYGVGNIYSRSWSAVEPGNSGNPISFGANRAAGTPAFGWANGVEYATQTPGGVINSARTATGATTSVLNQHAFNPDGSLYSLVRGPVFGNLMINSSSNHIATPIAQWNLKPPLQQLATMARATYDVSDSLSAYVEGGYARSSIFALSQYHQTPTLTVLASNPYLPASIKALLAANNITQFDMGRVDTDWLGTTGNNVYSTFHGAAGVKGKLFGDFKWDLGYSYGRSLIKSQVYGTREANLAAAEYAVLDANGNIVCGPIASNPNFAANRLTNTIQIANVQPGCVPLNPFGAGHVSDAARNYVSGYEYTRDVIVQHDVAANLNGTIFNLPAGGVAVAIGAEYRHNSLNQTVDPYQQQGLYSSGNNKAYGGKQGVVEGYGEIEVPLLKDITLARSLALNGAVRRTHYQISGGVTTWKLGATYEPIKGLRLRATRSRDIRAPSLSDLFLIGGISATGSFFNPFNGQSARLPVQTVGNPTLKPEIADTFSAGGTFQGTHGFLSGARLSIDYFDIRVKNVIATVAPTDILTRCFQGNQLYCSAIQFDNSTFGIAKILTEPFNQSLLRTTGIDFEAGYRGQLAGIGLPGGVDLTVYATRLLHSRSTDVAGPSGVTLDYAGYQNAQSKWVVSTYFNYHLNPITVGLQMRAFTPIRFSPLFVGPDQPGYNPAASNSINKNTFEGQALFNLNLAYDFERGGRKFQIFGNVNNLFNIHPPQFAIAAINLGGNPYDYVGRTFKLGVRFGL